MFASHLVLLYSGKKKQREKGCFGHWLFISCYFIVGGKKERVKKENGKLRKGKREIQKGLFCGYFVRAFFFSYGYDEIAKENQLWMAYCLGNKLEMDVESIEAYLPMVYFWGYNGNTKEE